MAIFIFYYLFELGDMFSNASEYRLAVIMLTESTVNMLSLFQYVVLHFEYTSLFT